MHEKIDTALSVIFGGIPAAAIAFVPQLEWLAPVFKIGMAIILGACGTLGGLLMKDVYPSFKIKVKSWFKFLKH